MDVTVRSDKLDSDAMRHRVSELIDAKRHDTCMLVCKPSGLAYANGLPLSHPLAAAASAENGPLRPCRPSCRTSCSYRIASFVG
jgi:hypothetical protein